MTQDRFQTEVMDEFEQMWEDAEPHKRPDYAEKMAELAEIEIDRMKEELYFGDMK